MHPLLLRQLKKLSLDASQPPSAEDWRRLLERASATYTQADRDRYTLERSLDTASAEMSAEIEQTNERLTASLALADAVQESVGDGILVLGPDQTLLSMNGRFRSMWSVPKSIVSSSSTTELIAHMKTLLVDSEQYASKITTAMKSPEVAFRSDLELTDGRTYERESFPIWWPDGAARGRVVCYRDVTDERRLDARRAVVAERMASVGQLVASVGHEINNPLAYVSGNVDLVLDSLRGKLDGVPKEELIECLSDAAVGIERIRVIVRDLRVLSRVEEEAREPIDVHATIEMALSMAKNQIMHHAVIARELAPVPRVMANQGRLVQVLLNLLVNAAQAMPDGRATKNTITVRTSLDASEVRIDVEDTGAGIEPEHLERIFDPFFTTKPVGAGTGLGLSICRKIVDQLDGRLRVQSVVGKGTTFTIELPVCEEKAPEPVAPTAAEVASPRRHILIVDDDPRVRRWMDRALRGHTVSVVGSVREAMAWLARNQPDAIVCDVMMPDQSGADMHDLLAKEHPALVARTIYVSGGAFTPALADFFERIPNLRLKKPVRALDLKHAISIVTAG